MIRIDFTIILFFLIHVIGYSQSQGIHNRNESDHTKQLPRTNQQNYDASFRGSLDLKGTKKSKPQYFFSSSVGYGGNMRDDINIIIGRMLSDKFVIGLGAAASRNRTSVQSLVNRNNNSAIGFIYGRYDLIKNHRPKIFAHAKIGHAFPVSQLGLSEHFGGIYLTPGLGIELPFYKKAKLIFAIERRIQHIKMKVTSFDLENDPIILPHSIWYNKTFLRFGVIIKNY